MAGAAGADLVEDGGEMCVVGLAGLDGRVDGGVTMMEDRASLCDVELSEPWKLESTGVTAGVMKEAILSECMLEADWQGVWVYA